MPVLCPRLDLIISPKRLRVSEEPAYKSSRSFPECEPVKVPGADKRLEPEGGGAQRRWDGGGMVGGEGRGLGVCVCGGVGGVGAVRMDF